METEDTAQPVGAAPDGEGRGQQPPHARIDWRTGRPMLERGVAFWREHAARRIEQGLSVAAYCEANGLAKSTFRRYAAPGRPAAQCSDSAPQAASAPPSRFVPVGATSAIAEPMVVEIETGQGMKLRLAGAAADRLVQHVLARLA